MAHFDEHCNDCIAALGEPFPQVHLWLDAFFPVKGVHHRVIRHHRDGVEEVRKAWGDKAAKAAEIHIRKDCYGIVPSKEQAVLWDLLT